MEMRKIQRRDAMRLLRSKGPHKLKVWKLSTGDIVTYKDASFVKDCSVDGIVKIRLAKSNLLREFHFFCLFEIDDLEIYW